MKEKNTVPVWMKVPEAAEYFRIPRSRMYALIQSGEIPAVRLGQRSIRVNRREVEQLLVQECRIGGEISTAGTSQGRHEVLRVLDPAFRGEER